MAVMERLAMLTLGAAGSTTDVPPALLQKWLNAAADMGEQRLKDYRLYDDVYDGARRAQLRDRARRYLEDTTGVPFCENFAQPCVDSLAERLQVIGFQSSAAETTKATDPAQDDVTTDPPAQQAEQWWELDRMDGVQNRVHEGVLKRGDEYVIVDWDAGRERPQFCRQLPEQCKVVYSEDEPDTVAYGVKVWNTSMLSAASNPQGRRLTRMNVYWPDRIEKWYRVADGSQWERWLDDPEPAGPDTTWPTWWTSDGTELGDPLGVAMIHFRHKPRDDGTGRSRVRMAIPFQAELDKTLADLSDLVDRHALPQDYVTGVTGDVQLELFGGVWKADAPEAKFGRLEAADTAFLLSTIEGVLSRLARRMRIPMHVLTGGTPPSGEALKTSESGLIAVAEDCQTELGNAWEDAIMLGLKLAAAFGGGADIDRDLRVFTQWKNPESRSDSDDLAAAEAKKRLGVSSHTLISELGYDPEREAQRRQLEDDARIETQQRMFDAGAIGE